MKKLADLAPVGRVLRRDIIRFGIALGTACLASLGYLARLSNAVHKVQAALSRGVADAQLAPFSEVLGGALVLFPLVALGCLGYFIPLYYGIHFSGSCSAYLMRRLPQRGALHRRCLTLPLCMAGCTLLVGVGLLALYYALYCLLWRIAL